ncbi:hypothetical protein NN561_010424 [Cricetulus griseus]
MRKMTLADVAGMRAEPELQAFCLLLETQELARSSVGLRGTEGRDRRTDRTVLTKSVLPEPINNWEINQPH